LSGARPFLQRSARIKEHYAVGRGRLSGLISPVAIVFHQVPAPCGLVRRSEVHVSKRIEQSRKHGPFDPRYTKLVRLVTPRNPTPVPASAASSEKAEAGRSVPSLKAVDPHATHQTQAAAVVEPPPGKG